MIYKRGEWLFIVANDVLLKAGRDFLQCLIFRVRKPSVMFSCIRYRHCDARVANILLDAAQAYKMALDNEDADKVARRLGMASVTPGILPW